MALYKVIGKKGIESQSVTALISLNSKIFSKWTISSPDEITESNRFGPKGIDLSPKDMSKQVLPFGPFFGPKWLLPIQGHYIKPSPTSYEAIFMKLVSRL